MSKSIIAMYAGTFDPITLGHMDLVKRATKLFDRVIVGIAKDTTKQTLFSIDERSELAAETLEEYKQVEVMPFSGL